MQVLVRFTAVYCQVNHAGEKSGVAVSDDADGILTTGRFSVCTDCRAFLAYAIERRRRCPFEPKPACKHCPIHCYRADYRQRVRTIMSFSGRHLLLRGRLDLLWHYFF
jgi:hypothetical protein